MTYGTILSTRICVAMGLAVAGLVLSGCARLGAQSRIDPATVAVYPDAKKPPKGLASAGSAHGHGCPLARGPHDYDSGAIDLDCFQFPEDLHLAPATASARAAGAAPRPAAKLAYARAVDSRRERNRLAALLLKHSDDVCTVELGKIYSYEATVNTSLSVLNTALTTAANIVTGERASSILTGGATIAGASRDHANVHVYRNQFAYAISRAITLERETRKEAIERRYGDDNTQWTVDDAIRAVNDYHGQCSFYKGLELLLAAVENKKDLDRHQGAAARQTRLGEIDREIARQQAIMAKLPDDEAKKPYLDRIEALAEERMNLLTEPIAPSAPEPEPEPSEPEPEPEPSEPEPEPDPDSESGSGPGGVGTLA